MSQKPYNVESHMEGGLRRVYSARRTLSHLDAGILTADQFKDVEKILEDLEHLEDELEDSLVEERRAPGDPNLTPIAPAHGDD
jgi:hypothetical protein